jgi:glutamate-1-semialdehyde 2,1-aminomutase
MLMPSMERIRFVSSGTEAAMSAVRVARAATKRDRIIKFEGCYHGHADAFLVQAGSGAMTLGVPTSPGVPKAAAADTLLARYNDVRSVQRLFSANKGSIAAIIVEPIAGNMGLVLPQEGFLDGLRTLCHHEGALLIFDEVISGFRASTGGAQKIMEIRPDLTILGKIIGGGLPVGAYGGRREIMDLVAPAGPVYQAGTLSGNPLAMTAGLWSLENLSAKLYKHVAKLTGQLASGLADAARDAEIPLQVNAHGSLLTPFFTEGPVRDFQSALSADTQRYGAFHRAMLARGIYLPPSQFEAWFLSGAHTPRDVETTLRAARQSFRELLASSGSPHSGRRIESHAQDRSRIERHVLAFGGRNGAAPADQHAKERAFGAAENAADDCADTGAGADPPGLTFHARAFDRFRHGAAHRVSPAPHGDLVERHGHLALPIRARRALNRPNDTADD